MVTSNIGMQEPSSSSSSFSRILDSSGEEREYVDMENLKSGHATVTLQQIVQQPNHSIQTQNSYYDLMVSSRPENWNSSNQFQNGGNGIQQTIREHKILGKRKNSCHQISLKDAVDERFC
ncbi:hypothetical protein Phum_PHUM580790 [Pediculus humanus corporis]|uniref:Uncharacterized protein n=1 Tax=Pediculus humanus subsp. corporis TaxID=121224 RepID=E0W1Z6_PEDHC|nr:uncharacterized protein Phum_PHUM580790 [Pediculus humanus corporis]EEB19590.1 hypothetical protein Phum_PHUM580790 [Pediculus humanus corporis]